MFYLMSKDEEFIAFKAYQAWAERQTGTKLKCKWTDWGGVPFRWTQNVPERELNIRYQCLTHHNKMDKQKGSNKP